MKKETAVIGGDLRAVYAAKELFSRGIPCRMFALEKQEEGRCENEKSALCSSPYLLSEALEGAETVLLPIPLSVTPGRLHTPLSEQTILLSDLYRLLRPEMRIFGGKLTGELLRFGAVDLLENEAFAQANALPSAENALALALLNYPGVLQGSSCVVAGYGRIGKLLCRRLEALGAKVCVLTGHAQSERSAKNAGFEPFYLKEADRFLKDCRIWFNTIPQPYFLAEHALLFPEEGLYVELASPPYGYTPLGKEILGKRFLSAPGLPGRYSPLYAGRCIARFLIDETESRPHRTV